MDSGQEVRFNVREHPHVDYGYAVTRHSGQSQTADLANIECGLPRTLHNNEHAALRLQSTLRLDLRQRSSAGASPVTTRKHVAFHLQVNYVTQQAGISDRTLPMHILGE